MSSFRCGAILLIALASFAQSPQPNPAALSAEAIMARVAANQDRSEALRKEYVYKQQIHILTHKHGGKLVREETADYNMFPTPDGTEKKLALLTGPLLAQGKVRAVYGRANAGGRQS